MYARLTRESVGKIRNPSVLQITNEAGMREGIYRTEER